MAKGFYKNISISRKAAKAEAARKVDAAGRLADLRATIEPSGHVAPVDSVNINKDEFRVKLANDLAGFEGEIEVVPAVDDKAAKLAARVAAGKCVAKTTTENLNKLDDIASKLGLDLSVL